MRTTRIALALALLVSPAIASAQTTNCQATTTGVESGTNRPTCNVTKDVSTTINNILYLGIRNNGPIDLAANDTAAYEKTYRANGSTSGTTGTAVTTPLTLQSSTADDSVIVRANRGYILTINAATDIFSFDKDAGYNVCRDSGTATTCATTGTGLAGKSVKDLYWSKDAATFTQIPLSTAPAEIKNSTSGGRYASAINFKSAWFYATDIPGKYTATVVYTVTGQ